MINLKLSDFPQNGFVAMAVILIISAVVLAIINSVSLLSIGEAQSSLTLFKGEDDLTFVEGCVEDVMLKIRSNSSFSGTSITRPEGTCSITYTSVNPNWDITVTTSDVLYKRQIRVVFVRNSTGISLTSWKEI